MISINRSGEKLTKHIAFSETAVANGIPIKVSQKRYTFPPPGDVIEKDITSPCPPKGFLTRNLLFSFLFYNFNLCKYEPQFNRSYKSIFH